MANALSTTAVDAPAAHRRVVGNGIAGRGTDVGAATLTTTSHGHAKARTRLRCSLTDRARLRRPRRKSMSMTKLCARHAAPASAKDLIGSNDAMPISEHHWPHAAPLLQVHVDSIALDS